MTTKRFVKDPRAILDYKFDWSSWLATGETISSQSTTATDGLIVDSSSITDSDTSCTAWVSGGKDGVQYWLTNAIVTSAGRENVSVMRILVDGAGDGATGTGSAPDFEHHLPITLDGAEAALQLAAGQVLSLDQTQLSITESQISDLQTYATSAELTSHTSDTSNPHSVTAAQAGAYTTAQVDSAIDADIATHAALTETHGISAFGATLVDDADAATARTTLGLGTMAEATAANYYTSAQTDSAIDTDVATHAALTETHGISAFGATLVDDADAATARTTLGAAASSHTHATSDVTSGTFADARIAESNVTQHEAALTITESQISNLGTYEPDLGNPAADGYVLASTAAGVRSWTAASAPGLHASTHATGQTDEIAPSDIGALSAAWPTVSSGDFTLPTGGRIKPASDSTTALTLDNAAGSPILTVDSTNDAIELAGNMRFGSTNFELQDNTGDPAFRFEGLNENFRAIWDLVIGADTFFPRRPFHIYVASGVDGIRLQNTSGTNDTGAIVEFSSMTTGADTQAKGAIGWLRKSTVSRGDLILANRNDTANANVDLDTHKRLVISYDGTNYLYGETEFDTAPNLNYTHGTSSADPTTDAPDDWIEIQISGTTYYLPAYSA